eukprot:TRINITY_DN5863_c0_g1_i4.p1 TRINITY_DN5863_c0_g1~~TRINITY_DN5863_c0_g1_i4.p1  ORF type:complete len:573 (-),score=135.54 TRINITY_DN5863_c0_g1_i4:107-1825(-)
MGGLGSLCQAVRLEPGVDEGQVQPMAATPPPQYGTTASVGYATAYSTPQQLAPPHSQPQMPPQPQAMPGVAPPPASLTAGLPDPSAVERQKAGYMKSLDEQEKQSTGALEAQKKQQLDYLYAQADQQKKQAWMQIDQQVKQQEIALTQQYNQQLLQLNQQYHTQKAALEQQAMQLTMEYHAMPAAYGTVNSLSPSPSGYGTVGYTGAVTPSRTPAPPSYVPQPQDGLRRVNSEASWQLQQQEADNYVLKRKPGKFVTQTVEEQKKIDTQAARNQRGAISAEVVSDLVARDFVAPVYPKEPAEDAFLKQVVMENEKMKLIFGDIPSDALQGVIDAFYQKTVRKGEILIRQGDEGDCLYICEIGTLDIYVARPGQEGKGKLVVSATSGTLFGELALLYSAPRAATVAVTSPVAKLWLLDRVPFKVLVMQSNQQRFFMYDGWLTEVALFSPLNKYELSQIAELMTPEVFDAGEVIIKQGDVGDRFYMLEEGTCAAYMAGPKGEFEVKTYSKRGDYFGEVALMNSEPRRTTVRATGKGCAVISCEKTDFLKIKTPFEDVLHRTMRTYSQYCDVAGT